MYWKRIPIGKRIPELGFSHFNNYRYYIYIDLWRQGPAGVREGLGVWEVGVLTYVYVD